MTERCSSVEQLCLFTDEKIRGIFYSHDDDEELSQKLNAQSRRLSMAIKILKSYVGMWFFTGQDQRHYQDPRESLRWKALEQ